MFALPMSINALVRLGLIIISLGLVPSALSAVLYVDADNGNDVNTCLSPTQACQTLGAVYSAANNNDEIRMAAGEYVPPACQLGVDKPITFKGGYNSSFSQQSGDASLSLITSNGSLGYCRLMAVSIGAGEKLTLDTLTLTGVTNLGDGTAAEASHSGVILLYNQGADLHLVNTVIKDNHMYLGGGAIVSLVATDTVTIERSVIENNQATANGGALSTAGATVTITNSVFKDNKAPFGGALQINGGSLTLEDSVFEGNHSVSLLGLASGSYGGGAINLVASDATIERLLFKGNTSVVHGAAVLLDANSTATIQNATFYDNQVGVADPSGNYFVHSWGGAIGAHLSDLTLIYSTIYKNTAMAYMGPEATPTRFGAGLAIWGANTKTVSLFGNLFLDNLSGVTASNVDARTTESVLIDKGHNIFGYADTSGLRAIDGLDVEDSDQLTLFGAEKSMTLSSADLSDVIVDVDGPEDNGGGVPTIKLAKDGPAMNQIDSANAPFYGVGKSCQYGFTSIQQAHSAMKTFDGYEAGEYYFDLDKTEEEAGDENVSCSGTFRTQVNAEGWVLFTPDNATERAGAVYDEQTPVDDDNAFWVRSSNNYCDGTITSTDARGLPRVDFLNPADANQVGKVQKCDIGAFEYNDGYQFDCHDEDGARSENRIDIFGDGIVDIEICFGGDLSNATPKALLNNIQIGSVNLLGLLLGFAILGFTRSRRKIEQIQ
ncbi:MAG: right-handed parallel beta-helix repeat-containing protein [Cellvibrionales bacterium]|nr:right-handed parallel beta-helix repeat-containing protein [Cellvibrionales bacterium]